MGKNDVYSWSPSLDPQPWPLTILGGFVFLKLFELCSNKLLGFFFWRRCSWTLFSLNKSPTTLKFDKSEIERRLFPSCPICSRNSEGTSHREPLVFDWGKLTVFFPEKNSTVIVYTPMRSEISGLINWSLIFRKTHWWISVGSWFFHTYKNIPSSMPWNWKVWEMAIWKIKKPCQVLFNHSLVIWASTLFLLHFGRRDISILPVAGGVF